MNLIALIFGVVLVFAAMLFWTGRFDVRIGTLVNKEQKPVNVSRVGKNMGFIFLFAGAVMLLTGVSPEFREHGFKLAMIIWFLVTAIDIYCLEKCKFFTEQ